MTRLLLSLTLLGATALATALPDRARANEDTEMRNRMAAFLESQIRPWISDPAIVVPVLRQNARTVGYSATRIAELDATWQAEVGTSATPMIDSVTQTPLGDFLRDQVDGSAGAITEVFVMDARGLNVATSEVSSDYWQGDEPKHQQTYAVGPDAVHFSEIEYDESTQTYQAQISATLTDPETGRPIGAITIGIDADSLL